MYEFMSDSPFLTFFLALVFASVIHTICIYGINRPLRHANIRKHGYPPPHCDADGDFLKEEDD